MLVYIFITGISQAHGTKYASYVENGFQHLSWSYKSHTMNFKPLL